jgi:dihydropyrimidinase
LLLQGGRVVTAEMDVRADVLVRDGRVEAIGTGLSEPTARVYDISGKVLIPGPIDPHVHIAWPYLNARTADDFRSATMAAAWGGTTMVIDWGLQRGDSLLHAIAERRAEADSASVLDYALHGTITRLTPTLREELPRLRDAGVTVLKLYMTYRKRGIMADDGMLWFILNRARDLGYLVSVHAENPYLHEWNEAELRRAGVTDPYAHALHKPSIVEAEAIHRAIYLAREARCPLLIRHVSTAAGTDMIRRARAEGLEVTGETCPQYLFLTEDVLRRPDGHLFICSPPVRTEMDRQALWQGVADGTISFIGSDHAAFPRASKIGETAFDVPNGLPGIETRVPLLFAAVRDGRISLPRFVEVTSTAVARLYGLYPQKGTIAPGSDADLVVIDPLEQRILTGTTLHMATDWSPYDGMHLTGYPVMTIVRGQVLIDGSRTADVPSAGRFIPCRGRGTVEPFFLPVRH